jgi:GTP cyclohydrolase I
MTSNDDKSAKLAKAFEDLLRAVDRSPGTYPELLQTPVRASSMWLDDLLDGYEWNPADILDGGTKADANSGMIVVRDVFFHSTCPHHLLPYHGLAHIAYIPGERIIGFSKINRLVDCFAHRLTLQEEISQQVAQALVDHLGASWAGCVLDAEQLCMIVRGVRKPGSRAITSAYAGDRTNDQGLKMEFLTTIGARE